MTINIVFYFQEANFCLLGIDECGGLFDIGVWYRADVDIEDNSDMAMLSAAKEAALAEAEETVTLNPECRIYGWDDRTSWRHFIICGMDLPDDDYLG